MTGFRVGYLALPSVVLAEQVAQIAEGTAACPSAVSQRAALAAVTGPQECVAAAVASCWRRRDDAVALLTEAGVECIVPRGAVSLLVDVSAAGRDGEELALRLLREDHVAVAPGEAFGAGGAGFVRVSLASEPAALTAGLCALVDLLARHRVEQAATVHRGAVETSHV